MEQPVHPDLPWIRYILATAMVNGLAGAFIFVTQGEWWPVDFWTIQVYSHAVGFSIMACNIVLRLLIPQARSSFYLRMSLFLLSVPIGYETGMTIAAGYFGHPLTFGAFMRMTQLQFLILLTSAIFMIFLFWAHRRITEAARARAEALQLAAEVQLRLLQAQLEPHMLFNTLANLHSLIEVDAERAQLMVEHLIEFMRRTLSASRKETATLEEEFAMIGAYLKLMAIRMGPRLSFDLRLPEELAQESLPAMLLQPLVENAIKHGLEPKVAGGTILVEAQTDGKWLQVSVSDTGMGLSENMSEEQYGTTHVQERLRALYGQDAGLTLTGVPSGGMCATVRMPR